MKNALPKSLGRIEFMNVDLSDLRTVKPAVEAFLTREPQLHVLVSNAGVRQSSSLWPSHKYQC